MGKAVLKRNKIEVREKGTYMNPGALVEVIQRKVWLESIGNFCPLFCRYKGKRVLVQSHDGDVSDPCRVTAVYLNSLYIEIEKGE